MKTPDEIKKGLECCFPGTVCKYACDRCPYNDLNLSVVDCEKAVARDALAIIQQLETKDVKQAQRIAELEANYRQLSKALCGKENATLEELLQGASQVKAELAAVKWERDAAVEEWKRAALHGEAMCMTCKFFEDGSPCLSPVFCVDGECWKWRGVCPENTEVQPNG